MKPFRWHLAFLLVAAIAVPSFADTVLVDENFDDYADDNAFWASWESSNGSDDGVLVPNDTFDPPLEAPPGTQGQAVDHLGGSVNQWVETALSVVPSATQSVVLGGDIYDNTSGNKRMTIGLRNSSSPNIFELGFYNATQAAAGYPEQNGAIGWAFRIVLWDGSGDNTDWQFFEVDPGFDRPDDDGDYVNPADIQIWAAANGLDTWHRWEATITESDVTITFDLFRDGLRNNPADNSLSVPGVDAEVTWNAVMRTDSPFDSLRIGAPSGIASAQGATFDNILLMLKDLAAFLEADFNEDGSVDGDDFLLWQGGFGQYNGDAVKMNGDANADGFVDGDDFLIWQQQFGSAEGDASGAVPEPASVALGALALLAVAGLRRRRA